MPGKVLEHADNGLSVLLDGRRVGILARTSEGLVAFQYARDWVQDGFSLNPYSLPLSDELFIPDWQPFGGLFGAFNDSLPDGWGALLLDRMLKREGIAPSSVDNLSRLAIVGSSGRGALTYEPQAEFACEQLPVDLDELAALCNDVLADRQIDDLDAVYAAGGSSGGARPKAYYSDEQGSWLVKFSSRIDPKDIGRLEYDFMACAADCGIDVPDYKLFPSSVCGGFFGTRRFDVCGEKRIHMLSASGLLEVSHRQPVLDYENLFQLSYFLNGSAAEAQELFRRMCFNVFAHNHDDHSNNFTWLCEETSWRLSPAYDLTYSDTAYRQHATSVLGAGLPGMDEVLSLAREVGLSSGWAKDCAKRIRSLCHELLAGHGLLPDA